MLLLHDPPFWHIFYAGRLGDVPNSVLELSLLGLLHVSDEVPAVGWHLAALTASCRTPSTSRWPFMVPGNCVNTWFLETFPGPPRGHSNTGARPAELPDFGLHLPEDMGATHLLGIGTDAADKERLRLPQCLQELVKGRLGKEGETLS